LDRVVSAQSIAVNEFKRFVQHRCDQRLNDKARTEMPGHLVEKESSDFWVKVAGTLAAAHGGMDFDRCENEDGHSIESGVVGDAKKRVGAGFKDVEFNERAGFEIEKRQVQRLSRRIVAERLSPRIGTG